MSSPNKPFVTLIYSRNRTSPLDIVCRILNELTQAEEQTMRPSQVQYRCAITWKAWAYYRERLQEKGLIEMVPIHGYTNYGFHITNEGLLLLQDYKKIMERI